MDVMSDNMERFLRDALAVEPSEAADGRILDAIRGNEVLRRWKRSVGWWAAAACLAVALAGGILRYVGSPKDAAATQGEVGDVMLEIIGMASIDEFYAYTFSG